MEKDRIASMLAYYFRSSKDYRIANAKIQGITILVQGSEGLPATEATTRPTTKGSDPKLYKYYVRWLKKNNYAQYLSA